MVAEATSKRQSTGHFFARLQIFHLECLTPYTQMHQQLVPFSFRKLASKEVCTERKSFIIEFIVQPQLEKTQTYRSRKCALRAVPKQKLPYSKNDFTLLCSGWQSMFSGNAMLHGCPVVVSKQFRNCVRAHSSPVQFTSRVQKVPRLFERYSFSSTFPSPIRELNEGLECKRVMRQT